MDDYDDYDLGNLDMEAAEDHDFWESGGGNYDS